MAVELDRKALRALLEDMAEIYPQQGSFPRLDFPSHELERSKLMHYLQEHRLVEVGWFGGAGGGPRKVANGRITAAGMDFLADDGGLTAILGVVTVKLHEDTIRQLLIQKVQASDEEDGVKARLTDQIKDLPAEGLKTIATKLMETGIQSVPNIVSFLGSMIS